MMQSKVNGQTDCHLGPNSSSAQGTPLSPSRHSNVKKVTGVGGTTYEISVWEGWGPGRQTFKGEGSIVMATTSNGNNIHNRAREDSLLPFTFFNSILTNQGRRALPHCELLSNQRTSAHSGPAPVSVCLYWRSGSWSVCVVGKEQLQPKECWCLYRVLCCWILWLVVLVITEKSESDRS